MQTFVYLISAAGHFLGLFGLEVRASCLTNDPMLTYEQFHPPLCDRTDKVLDYYI